MIKFKSKETKVWFTSDTHYWHSNIVFGVSNWSDKENTTRKFNTVEEMSRHLVEQINHYVKENDVLFHLGDWSFGGIDNIWNFRKQLRCQNIHLVLGNHDHHITRNKVLPNCHWGDAAMTDGDEVYDGAPHIYANHTDDVNAQEIFTSVQKYLEVVIDDTLVMMLHFPIEDFHMNEWKNVIHLFGHVHGKIPHGHVKRSGFRIDVGIDNAYKLFKEYRPFSWEEIVKLSQC